MSDWRNLRRFSTFFMITTSLQPHQIASASRLGLRIKKASDYAMDVEICPMPQCLYNALGPYLHAYMLPRWGMPIGELWGLEKLAEKCREEGRYTFFLSSAPDNVVGMLLWPFQFGLSVLSLLPLLKVPQGVSEAGQMHWQCFNRKGKVA